jgi:Protein of unknown function (DUF3209)
MACHEIAALRLGLMQVLGRTSEAERQHEIAELGNGAEAPGPIRSMCQSRDLASLQTFFAAALAELNTKVACTAGSDPQLPYYRTLVVLTKKVELELQNQVDTLTRLYHDLDEMHDFVHEIYPGG